MPLKFGAETLTSVTCARVRLNVIDRSGRTAVGWGETPLNVQWTWPGDLSYAERQQAMIAFCNQLAAAWAGFDAWGHSLELGYSFQHQVLPQLIEEFNANRPPDAHLPYLAALVCCSSFDIALHDAYGRLHEVPTYATYNRRYMNCDLAELFAAGDGPDGRFRGKYPADFLAVNPARALPVWHLVGGWIRSTRANSTATSRTTGIRCVLTDWIDRDGLMCLKVKLRGNDRGWDYERLVRVGQIGMNRDVSMADGRFQLHGAGSGLCQRDSRPSPARRARYYST